MTHKQAYADRQYLWSIAPADDMTGGYVDQDDLEKLLKNPTAKVATECLCNQIGHWFTVGYDTGGREAGDSGLLAVADATAINKIVIAQRLA